MIFFIYFFFQRNSKNQSSESMAGEKQSFDGEFCQTTGTKQM